MHYFVNLKGRRFGRLKVFSKRLATPNNEGNCRGLRWYCICDCGNSLIIRSSNLMQGRTRSCGCLKREITIKQNKARIGEKHSEKAKQKMSETKKGKRLTLEHRQKISNSLYGNTNNKGNTHSLKTRQKMSESHSGERCYNWQGGKSFEPYCQIWTRSYKAEICERDNDTCQCCGVTKNLCNNGKQISMTVHHIDYDKKNCSPENLITLCSSCNTKANYRRHYWRKMFTIRMELNRRLRVRGSL